MSGYNPSAQVWQSSLAGGGSARVTQANIQLDPPGSAGNHVPVTYLAGPSTSKIVFPEVYGALTEMSICTVTRYTSNLPQFRQRIFTSYNAQINWLHGQYSGYSGAALYNGAWLGSPWYMFASTATVWVSTCSSFNPGSGAYTLDVNGKTYSNDVAGMVMPDSLTINSNSPNIDSQWSAFGVAELLVWNRAISATELLEAQTYLTGKYGLLLQTPPAPPMPAAPAPPGPPMAASLANGMLAWCARRAAATCIGAQRCASEWPVHGARTAVGCVTLADALLVLPRRCIGTR
jgi:hypothetical protein